MSNSKSSVHNFRPLPANMDTAAMIKYHESIGVTTFGLWVIRMTEDPTKALTTTRYTSRCPMLPRWILSESQLLEYPHAEEPNSENWNNSKVEPKKVRVQPYVSFTPLEDTQHEEGRPRVTMPVFAEASGNTKLGLYHDWVPLDELAKQARRMISGDDLFEPYLRMSLSALALDARYS